MAIAAHASEIRTILVPVDFSDSSLTALEWARVLARPFGAKIVLLHVLDLPLVWMPVGGLGTVPTPMSEEGVEALAGEARTVLDAVAHGEPEVEQRLLQKGHPREVILDVARETNADIIVMGTHGRRGVTHLFMGSIAEYVVRHSPVPVCTVRAPQPTR